MSTTLETLMRDWFENAWDRGDETTIDRLMHPDAVIHGLPAADGGPFRGSAQFRSFYRSFRAAFPDISVQVLRVVSEGDVAVAYCRATATHRGEGIGMAATQRPIDVYGFTMGRFANGKLVEAWNCFDFLSLYQQLGAQLDLSSAQPAAGV
jgi:predicted ester cyclase